MKNNPIGFLFRLPSANVIKVTRLFNENLEVQAHEMVAGVYVANPDRTMKTVQVRRDWFEAYAVAL